MTEEIEETAKEDTAEEEVEEELEEEEELSSEEKFSHSERMALIEALLFASGDAVTVARLRDVTGLKEEEVRDHLESLQMKYSLDEYGIELVEIAGKFQYRTKAPFGPYLQKLKAGRPKKLSHAAFETLAVVAYRQPIVKSEIETIRGVDATPTLKTLLDRGLIRIVGHRASAGQPALYGTTERFLSIFNISSLSELPSLRELRELEEDPGESGEEEPDELEKPEESEEEQPTAANG